MLAGGYFVMIRVREATTCFRASSQSQWLVHNALGDISPLYSSPSSQSFLKFMGSCDAIRKCRCCSRMLVVLKHKRRLAPVAVAGQKKLWLKAMVSVPPSRFSRVGPNCQPHAEREAGANWRALACLHIVRTNPSCCTADDAIDRLIIDVWMYWYFDSVESVTIARISHSM